MNFAGKAKTRRSSCGGSNQSLHWRRVSRRSRPHVEPSRRLSVFIRSMATRGHLGGLALPQPPIWRCCSTRPASYLVLVETVGVGQDEVEIAKLADVTVVVLVPGMGDDVQAIKAGFMEIADVFVINKSDQQGADRLEREILAIQSLSTRPDGWVPPIVRTVATEGQGIGEALAAVRSFGRAGARTVLSPTGACACARCFANGCSINLRTLIFRLPPKRAAGVGPVYNSPMAGLNNFNIDHLGIAVRSLDAALGFYEEQLGFPVSRAKPWNRKRSTWSCCRRAVRALNCWKPPGPIR